MQPANPSSPGKWAFKCVYVCLCISQLKSSKHLFALISYGTVVKKLHEPSIIHVWFLLCELLLASRRYLAKIAAVLQQSPPHRCSWSNTQRMESSIKSVSSLTFCCLSVVTFLAVILIPQQIF